MIESSIKNLHLRITGRVQGVWFRAWTRQTATALGLNGWVRNCADGTVEAVFSGPEEGVRAMLAACHNGPEQAQVERVEAEPCESPLQSGFEIRPDR